MLDSFWLCLEYPRKRRRSDGVAKELMEFSGVRGWGLGVRGTWEQGDFGIFGSGRLGIVGACRKWVRVPHYVQHRGFIRKRTSDHVRAKDSKRSYATRAA